MSGQRKDIEDKLKSLPESFSADQIEEMYSALVKDIKFMKLQGKNKAIIESQLHQKHETLAYSYPTIFFKTMRGEMDPHIFKSLMEIKRKMEKGEISQEGARRAVIDGAKAHVMSNPDRPKRVIEPGSTVQEITLKCRVEDDDNVQDENPK